MMLTTTALTRSAVVTFSSVLYSSSFSVVAWKKSQELANGRSRKRLKNCHATQRLSQVSPHLQHHLQLLPCRHLYRQRLRPLVHPLVLPLALLQSAQASTALARPTLFPALPRSKPEGLQTCLLILVNVHAEPQHALYPACKLLGVAELVARAQRGRLKQEHGDV